MGILHNRRQFIGAGLGLGALTLLPACAGIPGLSMVDAIRELLTLSSQRAFARLIAPGGFYDSEVSRIALPNAFQGSGGVIGALLSSGPFKTELQKQVNKAAEKGAERAAPLVLDSIKSVSISDALSIVQGGSTAATGFLRGQMGNRLLDALVPGVSDGLKLMNDPTVSKALSSVSGFDVAALSRDISGKADNAIWNSIGVEEGLIRKNPSSTGNPALMAVFGAGKLL